MGDYIGKSGVEYTYEKYLRGVKGRTINLVDVHNRIKGKYKNGAYDIHPVIGSNIKLTIDIDLQMYAEKLMQNKRGSVVAIEPSTGEILAKVREKQLGKELNSVKEAREFVKKYKI